MGKVSTNDMYRSIERLTCNTGIGMPSSRYRPTMRCLTQWRHLKALKQRGRGHDPSGAEGTVNGGLAIPCPSCPHPGINIPSRWKDLPDEKQYVHWSYCMRLQHSYFICRFLYSKLVCMDANFRLKNNLVSNLSTDPGLGNGMTYMVPRQPYEAYVLSQADAEDVSVLSHNLVFCNANVVFCFHQISTCVGFQALAKATTQSTRGLRYTGVGAVVCGRSEMVLPNAVGNLQKGERCARRHKYSV